jgi:biotin transport system substrate-specific component
VKNKLKSSVSNPEWYHVKTILPILLFTGLICLGAQIRIPTGQTPIVMTTVFIYLAGLILGRNKALIATTLYVLSGLAGLPVFSGGSGGFQHIYGPTGGYLVGFMAAAWLIGGISERFRHFSSDLVALLTGSLTIHSLGIMWMYFNFPEVWISTKAIYVNYILADSLKILFVLIITPWLRKILSKEILK